ncbi:short subunit dehydrogenase [Paraburkholderia sp. RAU2J]|nr:short subunit dehydrogenase [Paraburkholderia sp. RAU2J]
MPAKRVAFITGGMGGLGAAISRRLHDAGMVVTMSHSERNDHVATWLIHERDAGRHFVAYEADVSSFDSCAHCAERVLAEFGTVDILVNNAAITRDSTFVRMNAPNVYSGPIAQEHEQRARRRHLPVPPARRGDQERANG